MNCNLYFTTDEIKNSTSRKDGISVEIEDNLRRYGAEIIQEGGILLQIPQATIASAQIIFHRFYCRNSFKKYELKNIAMGSLFIYCKYTTIHRKIRDFLNVFTYLWQRRDGVSIENIDYLDTTKQHYWDLKGDVMTAEYEILREFGFLLTVDLPHKYILNYMKLLDQSQGELAQKSWNYINDSMRTTLACQYKPEAIAASAIFLASRILKKSLPEEPYPWWEIFDVSKNEIESISIEMNKLYSKPKPYYINLIIDNNNGNELSNS
ncbi:cyclin [Tieghemostelium lacteum]|uniref:Cyclin n=1 Tax=Tieghemostelium lacteum TaxID=361077 RepID=A0A151ZG26_TIELA|nr:cyclin [Tieghemostelium lacteum]|eukprot:KYQ92932.1 cyclin [Tieghemostelium lacteum]